MSNARTSRLLVAALLLTLGLGSCGRATPRVDGYKAGVVPGISLARCTELLGKPQQSAPFSLPGTKLSAEVLTYPFGQVLVQNGTVVAVSVNNDPQFRGPFGVRLGMSEDDAYAALASHPRKRTGHRELYDAIEKTSDTRTKDIYDETDQVIVELTAANANDPLAPFNIAQVTLANSDGVRLIEEFTKARLAGLYPDVHVINFVSDPWQGKR
ncbi:MAG: hypothetical protein M3Z41_09620 [Candidatus Eremiobacteraeota bacterium]|nr:hypothetical protein [Candidatus Eremiobacteraeota bacterium]